MITRLRRAGLATLAAVLVVLGAPLGEATAQTTERIRVDLDQLTPRVADATTPTVTVTGTITNTGDRRIDDIQVRLERGDLLGDESALRRALNEPHKSTALTKPTTSVFKDVSRKLERGQSSRFELTVGLGQERGSLKVDKPGIYQLVLNFNGVPDFGTAERIGALSALLPVLSVPGGDAIARPADPSKVGMLWPLVDEQPRPVEIPAGGGKPVFADEGLADSLSGGRLFSLLNAVQQAAVTDNTLLRSLCFAIDPDLVHQVDLMSKGYVVGRDGVVSEGRGQETAALWLSVLRDLTKGQCVVSLPFADADLVALSRSDTVDLQTVAISASDVIEKILEVKPQAGVVWPDGGTLDQRTLADLSSARRTTVLADSAKLQQVVGKAPLSLNGDSARAIPYDTLVASSLAPRGGDSAVKTSSVQNGLATLVFRGAFTAGQNVLVAPPRRWSASIGELRVFLQTLRSLHSQGYTLPLPLPSLVELPDQGKAGGLDYSAQDSGAEVTAPVTAEIARINTVQRELIKNVFTKDATVLLDPSELLAPIRDDLIRASSTAWRSRPAEASNATRHAGRQLKALLSRVTINDSGVPLSLASSDSPIPAYITNGLPVAVRARVNVGDTPGLRSDQSVYVRIPAGHSMTQFLPVSVSRAGRFTVDVWLTTESGTTLGATSQVKLNSTSYGSITLAVTGTAAGALVLLVSLRLFRRIRAKRMAAAAENDL
ncbi:hypothetical protein SAMN05192558_106438 [Actinokineospora alba]|uniref:Glycoprotein n=1 Tax=Actinokineospora alba TaxID=504798 RepID=A0A1H0Q7X6_9PSEU|nr:DUF6049 family protein [Actinokineospora alba]TDP66109.1 hypothetical protein C8E96_1605 [Actinokineospora alba]SDI57887.1 hypothetical protein SAMN05421871_10614 [Actinokineospora alba]SDP13135.1 hypothetical protein SAMN05192558_106438 [Actinokineospora alba]